MNVRYYFVTDNIARKNMRVVYCPTEEMVGDFFTKPLQGSLFRKFRRIIMNLPEYTVEPQECVGKNIPNPESAISDRLSVTTSS